MSVYGVFPAADILSVFILSAFCDCYNFVKWQTLKSREFATSFVLTLRK